jgi:import receptor subunit TOM20
VAALDADLEGKGTHCSHCLKSTDPESAIRSESDKLGSTYCSKECELKATTQYESLLFAAQSPISSDIDPTNTPEMAANRATAQDALIAFIRRTARAAPLLVARFVARQVSGELAKLFPGVVPSAPVKEFASGDFSLYDHMERLRYLELDVPEDEGRTLRDLFEYTMAGLEQAIADDRYATLKGKFSYNAYGVFHGEGRADRVRRVPASLRHVCCSSSRIARDRGAPRGQGAHTRGRRHI